MSEFLMHREEQLQQQIHALDKKLSDCRTSNMRLGELVEEQRRELDQFKAFRKRMAEVTAPVVTESS
jgi:flagellar biosynthesis/type III secretory pathway chaperone